MRRVLYGLLCVMRMRAKVPGVSMPSELGMTPLWTRIPSLPDGRKVVGRITEDLSLPLQLRESEILLARGDLDMEGDLESDTRPVFPLVEAVIATAGASIRWMRDPTRGGVATSLNELARDSRLSIMIELAQEFPGVRPGPRRRAG